MTDIKNWSEDAANNSQAGPDGWPEGMPRSDVNNSAREMMRAMVDFYRNAEWINPYSTTGDAWLPKKGSGTITVRLEPQDGQGTDITGRFPTGSRFRIESNVGVWQYGFITSATLVTINIHIEVAFDVNAGGVPNLIDTFEIGVVRDMLGETAYYPTGTTRDEEPPQVPTIDDLGDGVLLDMGHTEGFNADMVDGQHAADIIATASATSNRGSVTNSEFQVWQRGTSITDSVIDGRIHTNDNGSYTADRWRLEAGNASTPHDNAVDVARDISDVPTGFWSAMKSTVTGDHVAGNDMFGHVQIIESRESRQFIDSTSVSMSVYLKSNGVTLVNARFMVLGYSGAADDATELADDMFSNWGTVGDPTGPTPNTNWEKILDSGQITITGTWAQYSELNIDFSAAVGAVKNIALVIYADSAMATGNTMSTTGVQLVNGASVPNYGHSDYDTELRRCERYYANTFDEGSPPRNTEGELTSMQWYSGNSKEAGDDGPAMQYLFPTLMRKIPDAVTVFNAVNDTPDSWYDQQSAPGNPDLLVSDFDHETITQRYVNWTNEGGQLDNKVLRGHIAVSAEF
jgi:hypothetical protein